MLRLLQRVAKDCLPLAVILFFLPISANSQLVPKLRVWTGLAGNNLWSDTLNWLDVGVPSIVDTAKIGSTDSVYISSTDTVAGLILNGGKIAGTGTLVITDKMSWNGGTLAGQGLTIIGSNAILVSDSLKTSLFLDGRTLTIDGNAVLSLNLFVSSGARINNNGTFEIASQSIFLGDASSPAINNAGRFTKTTISTAEIGIAFNNAGSTALQAGTLQFKGGGTSSSSTDISQGASLDIPSGTFSLNSGSSVTGSGFVKVTGGTLAVSASVQAEKVQIDSGAVTLTGTLTVNDTLTWNKGTINSSLSGSLVVPIGGTFIVQNFSGTRLLDGTPVNNSGTLRLMADLTVSNGADLSNSGTFELQSNHILLAGAGSSTSSFYNGGVFLKTKGPPGRASANGRIEVSFENAGTLNIDSLSSLELAGPFVNFTSNALSGGSYFIEGTFKFRNANIQTNAANITLSGNNASITDSIGTNALANFRLNSPTGIFTIVNRTIAVSVGDSLRNEGILHLESGSSLNVGGDYIQASGTTNFRSGSSGGLSAASSLGTVRITGGTFYGNGTVSGSLTNSGTLRVADTVGTLNVSLDFTQTPSGALYVDIGGTTPGTDLDRVNVFGMANLGGTVYTKLINGFLPSAGNRVFSIMNYEVRSGTFSSINDLDPDDGVRFIANYDTASITNLIANFAPTFTATLNDTTINENQTLAFTYQAQDPELTPVVFSVESGSVGASINSSTGLFSWTPSYSQAGAHAIVIGASDTLEIAKDTVIITVTNVNRLPLFTKTMPDTAIAENQTLSFTVLGTDPDLDVLTFSKYEGPTASAVSSSGVFSWRPTYSDSGTHRIIISLTDTVATLYDTAYVIVTNVNQLPQFTRGLPDTTLQENSSLSFSLLGVDPDLDSLTFAKVGGPGGMTVSAAGLVSWTIGYSDSGTYPVVVSLSDGIVIVYDTATVVVPNVNRLPQFVARIPDTTISENQLLSYALQGSDPDLDPVTFAKVSGPSGVSVTPSGGFTWTPSYSDSGAHQIVVSLSDGLGAVNDTAFITVTNVNRLPFFTKTLSDTTVAENDSLGITLLGSDPDLDALTFTKISGPPAAIVSGNGVFSWRPGYSDAGTYEVVLSLSDGVATIKDTATITVTNVNLAPVFTYVVPDTTIGEGWLLTVVYTALDPDGTTPSFALTSGPPGAALSSTGSFSWSPTYLQAGQYIVVAEITDGLAVVRDTALVTVYNVNRVSATFALLTPANDDTLKLSVPPLPILFRWRKSVDPDTDDTLSYFVRVQGPGLDTMVTVKTDTSIALDIMSYLQSSSQYHWSVQVTDRSDTVGAEAIFAFRTSAAVTGIEQLAGAVPEEFELRQNYPNPFNPSTVIRYGLPARSSVRLEIYDMLGKRVATLVDEEQEGRYYEVRWDAMVASGVYFTRFEAASVDNPNQRFVQVRKMVLLR